jgi:UDP-N-acetylmuramoyl-tripeptide--D-alanyl-D-alanine ligase
MTYRDRLLEWNAPEGVSTRVRGDIVMVDGTALSGARAAVDVLKAVRGLVLPEGRIIAVMGGLDLSGDSDYDNLEAFGAVIVRLGIALTVAVGPAARPIFLSVGREGSWDGESQYSADASNAYDEVRGYIEPGDIVVILGGAGENLSPLVQKLGESLP